MFVGGYDDSLRMFDGFGGLDELDFFTGFDIIWWCHHFCWDSTCQMGLTAALVLMLSGFLQFDEFDFLTGSGGLIPLSDIRCFVPV